jgi:hypothetical protein
LPATHTIAAGRDDDLGGVAERLGQIALPNREIADVVAGTLQEIDEVGAGMAPISRLFVVVRVARRSFLAIRV